MISHGRPGNRLGRGKVCRIRIRSGLDTFSPAFRVYPSFKTAATDTGPFASFSFFSLHFFVGRHVIPCINSRCWPTSIQSQSPSLHGHARQHAHVSVEGVVLEHALADEDVVHLPEHVLPQAAPQHLWGGCRAPINRRLKLVTRQAQPPPQITTTTTTQAQTTQSPTSLMVAPPWSFRGLM